MKKGFTLAEVLVTLAIIGTVVAISIPALLKDLNDTQLKAAWKKTYAEMTQAFKLVLREQRGNLEGDFAGSGYQGSEEFKNVLAKYFTVLKDCSGNSSYGGSGNGASSDGCWHQSRDWYFLNGRSRNLHMGNPGFILNNGALVTVRIYSNTDCNRPVGDYHRCGYIIVDTNGFKKPNTMGKDIFEINVASKFILPRGARGDRDPDITCIEGSTASSNEGFGCAAKYLYED